MAKKDYYEVLGLSKTASKSEITKAYRKLAKKYHPDSRSEEPDADQKFKDACEAYEILNDEQKRAQYDRYGHDAGKATWGSNGFPFDEWFFGAGHQKNVRPLREFIVSIDFLESIQGCKKDICVPKFSECGTCKASGWTNVKTCQLCNGSGRLSQVMGSMHFSQSCQNCHGRGWFSRDVCPDCKAGYVEGPSENVSITILANTENFTVFKLKSHPLLQIVIEVRPHEKFIKNGLDLICKVDVTFSQLVLGDKIDFETLNSTIKVKIPKGTAPSTHMRLRNEGVIAGGRCGDIIMVLNLVIPTNASDEYIKKLQELRELEKGDLC